MFDWSRTKTFARQTQVEMVAEGGKRRARASLAIPRMKTAYLTRWYDRSVWQLKAVSSLTVVPIGIWLDDRAVVGSTTAALRYSWPVFAGSGLVLAFVLVASSPVGPGPGGGAARGGGDQVSQETADLAERDRDEAAARAFGAVAAVTAR